MKIIWHGQHKDAGILCYYVSEICDFKSRYTDAKIVEECIEENSRRKLDDSSVCSILDDVVQYDVVIFGIKTITYSDLFQAYRTYTQYKGQGFDLAIRRHNVTKCTITTLETYSWREHASKEAVQISAAILPD